MLFWVVGVSRVVWSWIYILTYVLCQHLEWSFWMFVIQPIDRWVMGFLQTELVSLQLRRATYDKTSSLTKFSRSIPLIWTVNSTMISMIKRSWMKTDFQWKAIKLPKSHLNGHKCQMAITKIALVFKLTACNSRKQNGFNLMTFRIFSNVQCVPAQTHLILI